MGGKDITKGYEPSHAEYGRQCQQDDDKELPQGSALDRDKRFWAAMLSGEVVTS